MPRPIGTAFHAIAVRPRGRPAGPSAPSVQERMAAALCRHHVDLDDEDAVAALLRLSGFRLSDVARHMDEAIAAAKARLGRT